MEAFLENFADFMVMAAIFSTVLMCVIHLTNFEVERLLRQDQRMRRNEPFVLDDFAVRLFLSLSMYLVVYVLTCFLEFKKQNKGF